jgi:hypothetical protein
MLQQCREGCQDEGDCQPPGPASHAEMHQWCSQFASRLEQLSDGKGPNWLSMLLTRLQGGIQINTDYSGAGQPERTLKQRRWPLRGQELAKSSEQSRGKKALP